MKWVIDYLYPRNFDSESIPNLSRKVILITGGCSGLGYEIASQCAVHSALRIIIVSLPSQRLDNAVRSITSKLSNPQGQVNAVPADLADLRSVLLAIETIRSLTETIDIVFANAGICWTTIPLSPDGLETVFATNHVGHYALVTRLLPVLMRTASKENADVRVVITSSSLAWYAKQIDFNSLHTPFTKKRDNLLDMYTRSKLANLLFGLKLATHVRDRGCHKIYANVGDPGVIFRTGIHLQLEFAFTFWVRLFVAFIDWWLGLSVQDGALTPLFLGTSPIIQDKTINGQFYRPFGDMIPHARYPKYARKELAEKLWEWSEKFVSAKEAELRTHSLLRNC